MLVITLFSDDPITIYGPDGSKIGVIRLADKQPIAKAKIVLDFPIEWKIERLVSTLSMAERERIKRDRAASIEERRRRFWKNKPIRPSDQDGGGDGAA